MTNLEICAVRREVERGGAEVGPGLLCDHLVVEDESQVLDDISLDVGTRSILRPPVLASFELVIAKAPLAVVFSPNCSLCRSLVRRRRCRGLSEEGHHDLHQVMEVEVAVQIPLYEYNGEVLPIADHPGENMDCSTMANLVEVDEVLEVSEPLWYVASAR